MARYTAADIIVTKKFKLKNGINGKKTLYKDGTKGFFVFFPFGTIYKKFHYSDKFIEINAETDGIAEDDIKLSGYIELNNKLYVGRARNIKRYRIEIKDINQLFKINTRFSTPEPYKTVLTWHPSKNRTAHGAQCEINKVYKAGGMK